MSNRFVTESRRSKYRLLGLVGQGQFGRVYCASHRKTGHLVALKELDRERFSTHNFLRELRFLLSLQHENIVTCYALEQTSTGRYLVLDYCEGGTLRGLMIEDGRLHPVQSLKLVAQILAGLAHAHQRGIVHCDIKPENILLNVTADGWTARISDFGIARLSQEMASDNFSNTGSPAYMAPERFYGQYSPASDLYAVGILLFELLVGSRPFAGSPIELMSAHLNQAVKIPQSMPDCLRSLIVKALQKLPARRFRSAIEMLEGLRSAIELTEHPFSQEWATSGLLSAQPTAACDFKAEYQEALSASVSKLAVGEPLSQTANQAHFFRVVGNRLGRCGYTPEPLPETLLEPAADRSLEPCIHPVELPQLAIVRLPQPITDLVVRPDGCFATTQQAAYWVSNRVFDSGIQSNGIQPHQKFPPQVLTTAVPNLPPPELIDFEPEALVAIAPTGRWMATATSTADRSRSQVKVWNLQNLQPFRPAIAFETAACFQLLVLDSCHLVTFSNLTDLSSNACITGTAIEVFARRGNSLGAFKLPVPLRQVTPTRTSFRLMALEPGYSDSLLFLDLKPLRIQRVGLGMQPHLLTTAPWGYALTSREGMIVLLDPYGQAIGRIVGPVNPTAIVALPPQRLIITTWNKDQGNLYVINLQQLDLDILF